MEFKVNKHVDGYTYADAEEHFASLGIKNEVRLGYLLYFGLVWYVDNHKHTLPLLKKYSQRSYDSARSMPLSTVSRINPDNMFYDFSLERYYYTKDKQVIRFKYVENSEQALLVASKQGFKTTEASIVNLYTINSRALITTCWETKNKDDIFFVPMTDREDFQSFNFNDLNWEELISGKSFRNNQDNFVVRCKDGHTFIETSCLTINKRA